MLYKEVTEMEKRQNLEQFVSQNLHIGAWDVKKTSHDSNYKSRRFTSCKQRKSLRNQSNYTDNGSVKDKFGIIPNIQTTRNMPHNLIKMKRSETLNIKKQIFDQKTQFNLFKPLRKPAQKDYFIFGMADKNLPQNKIQIYRDFLWKVNYSNDIYVTTPETNESGYKAYIGSGNNSIMIRGILKRRFWWTITDKPTNVNFIWAQLKVNSFFLEQNQSEYSQKDQEEDLSARQDETDNPDEHRYIFRASDLKLWQYHISRNGKSQQKISEQTYIKRMWFANKKILTKINNSFEVKMQNHFQNNFYLGNKKALFYNLKKFYELQDKNIFTILPQTFHITKGVDDPEYQIFLLHYSKMEQLKLTDKSFRNIWIAKPGQNSNRGNGISVCFNLDDIRLRLRGKQKNSDGKPRTFIIQKYIQKPLLYHQRKFDIRHYLLITCMNGDFKAYWYQQGYIRTSSAIYSLRYTKDLFTHLTNDAIQKNGEQYGKYEKGNKVSYEDFQSYLQKYHKKNKINFYHHILPKMKQIALDAVKSTYFILDPLRKQRNFQIFGLDFMIDDQFQPWLIQCNTNPCLQLSCPLLARIIPTMIENLFRLCLDPLFPPPQNWPNSRKQFFGDNPLMDNKFQLIFDEKTDGKEMERIFKQQWKIDDRMGKIQEDEEIFDDDGNQQWESNNQP